MAQDHDVDLQPATESLHNSCSEHANAVNRLDVLLDNADRIHRFADASNNMRFEGAARRLSYAVMRRNWTTAAATASSTTLRAFSIAASTSNNNNEHQHHHHQHQRDYRSSHFNRARARTLRMTVIIVLAFILCWTPNVVMSVWFLADPVSAQAAVDPRVADVLFILTITNSVVNPYIYGSYASEMRSKFLKWFGGGGGDRRGRGQGGDARRGARPRLSLTSRNNLLDRPSEGDELLGMSEGRAGE